MTGWLLGGTGLVFTSPTNMGAIKNGLSCAVTQRQTPARRLPLSTVKVLLPSLSVLADDDWGVLVL
ncbi:unnamed protein product [Spirodela intermedia]|uniref:Uncharacterized protein n=2 Tax=Spirodela intermedia TaxID=51605 RepID=A0A7I8K793_SPIIN|nr:unnamed protein product [Spirodela intermedia]CAA6657486.1 unnamed protein product [Spirodela intermedia]CAA7393552.1 unnamed protein product [Spirodela intermedia]